MPPRLWSTVLRVAPREEAAFVSVKIQWQNPSDILSILMIIGGDVVQRAIAQLAGADTLPFTPVAFSFGWVAYSLTGMLSAVGDGRLMPQTDCPSILINAKQGYSRTNQSWVLGRLLRDHAAPDRPLTVSLYHMSKTKTMGLGDRDSVYYVSVLTILVQIGISIIPGVLNENWVIFIITLGGNLLAVATTAIPQWRAEKWTGRNVPEKRRDVMCLTRGNGSNTVIAIVSEGCGIRLEDLASGRDRRSGYTIVLAAMLSVLWIVHLLTVEAVSNDAWYALAVGALGMIQNVIAAGAKRSPGALGIHLVNKVDIYERNVFTTLQKAEELELGVGLSLLPVFFPGGLRDDEERWRSRRVARYAEEDMEAKKSTPSGNVSIVDTKS